MSTINVTNLSGRGGATPNLPDGANITGVATASGGFSGNLTGNVTGTGLTTGSDGSINVTSIRSVGVSTLGNVVITGAVGGGATVGAYAGVTTFYGDGSNLVGAGDSIAPHFYNPDVGDIRVTVGTGIGITFNKKVEAGSSGTATLKIVNAGVAGTTIQSWGVSSTTYNVTSFTLDALVSDLIINQTYQVDIPDGFIVDTSGTSYVGTGYTFTAQGATRTLFMWGAFGKGQLGQNNGTQYSSPVQVPGTSWAYVSSSYGNNNNLVVATKTDGTLWSWGNGTAMGDNSTASKSSPVQIPGTTWDKSHRQKISAIANSKCAIKTDGTLWVWGANTNGVLGQNQPNPSNVSSPIQIPGTNWKALNAGGYYSVLATKTDGTLWAWGGNNDGSLGQNASEPARVSSPVQIPGTNWDRPIQGGYRVYGASKTDGTLWLWGYNNHGQLGDNTSASKSSPIQIPGTTWNAANVSAHGFHTKAVKTDGTLWTWGAAGYGGLGLNGPTSINRSSPTQIPGTTWKTVSSAYAASVVSKTDGTLWSWGYNTFGQLGQNNKTNRSSPIQIGSETDWVGATGGGMYLGYAIREDTTP